MQKLVNSPVLTCVKQEDSNNQALARLRKFQHDVDEADERAEMAESQLAKLRAKTRAAGPSSGRVSPFSITSTTTSSTSASQPKAVTDSPFGLGLVSGTGLTTTITQPITQSSQQNIVTTTNGYARGYATSTNNCNNSYVTPAPTLIANRRHPRGSGGRYTSHEELTTTNISNAESSLTFNSSSSMIDWSM